jgi:hypothetical protein
VSGDIAIANDDIVIASDEFANRPDVRRFETAPAVAGRAIDRKF